jgi:uncharacterized membrane protein YcfT
MGAAVAAVRETWVDAAKGIAIILVVLYHSVIFMADLGLASIWVALSGLLDSFRMPLFFFTAGLFAAKALQLPFAQLFHHRVARLLWLYLLWSLIYVVVFQFVPIAHEGGPTWIGFLLIPVWPNASNWFIYALALFFTATWLMRSLPVWAQFVPALALTLVFGTKLLSSGSEPLDKMAIYYVFFLAAVHFGALARRFAPRVRTWHLVILVLVYGAIATVIVLTSAERIPGVRLLASVIAIMTGVSIAVRLDRLRAFQWLHWLGSHTLPVYLLHFYPILVTAALIRPFSDELTRLGVLIPPAMTLVAIAASLGIWRLTRRIPGLYDLPLAGRTSPTAPPKYTSTSVS